MPTLTYLKTITLMIKVHPVASSEKIESKYQEKPSEWAMFCNSRLSHLLGIKCNKWQPHMILQILKDSIDSLLHGMKQVVVEKVRFVFAENHSSSKLLINTWMWKTQPVVLKEANFIIKTGRTKMHFWHFPTVKRWKNHSEQMAIPYFFTSASKSWSTHYWMKCSHWFLRSRFVFQERSELFHILLH